MYLHRSCEISKKVFEQHREIQLHIHLAVSFTCTVFLFQMFFFFVSIFICPSVLVEGCLVLVVVVVEGDHIANKKIPLVSLSRLIHTA